MLVQTCLVHFMTELHSGPHCLVHAKFGADLNRCVEVRPEFGIHKAVRTRIQDSQEKYKTVRTFKYFGSFSVMVECGLERGIIPLACSELFRRVEVRSWHTQESQDQHVRQSENM